MKYYSTNNKNNLVSFREAVINGLADDGGLFMPSEILKMPGEFFEKISKYSFKEISLLAAGKLINSDLPEVELENIINSSITFDAPLVSLNKQINILELFHGPTLAFKDFGSRFMANTLSYLNRNSGKGITILVATSGDTGSAVANGFYNVEGINVILLYPSNKVSNIQEQQLTTLDKNITALEVLGTFDDCQRLVKQAFLDNQITSRKKLSSANSINIARLLPQSFYYFYAYAQLKNKNIPNIISVPSGNFGNLTAGLIAKKMGLPINMFVAATNSNDVFTKYLETSEYLPKPSIKTISNAMDVGDPSNFKRILDLYNHNHQKIKNNIDSKSFTDEETINAMQEVYSNYNYIIDPHGAVGYSAMKSFANKSNLKSFNGIILETAHPAKFANVVESALNIKIGVPERLKKCLSKEKHSIKISSEYNDFKEFLIN
jgi:threonine synthase